MALTLADYKNFLSTATERTLIDEIVKSSYLLQRMPVKNLALLQPVQGKMKWVYNYTRRETQRSASIRQVGNEFTPGNIQAMVDYAVECTILGGSFTFDRVMAGAGNVVVDYVAEEYRQLIEATRAKFNDLVINGDSNNAGEFDGLDVALAGLSTEWYVDNLIDLSTQANIKTNWETVRYELNRWLASLSVKPDALLMNGTMLPIMDEVANLASASTTTKDNFGQELRGYRGIPFVDLGEKDGSSDPVIPIVGRTIQATPETGLTDVYAVKFGDSEFHAISPQEESQVIRVYVPNVQDPGAVKTGEVELVTGVALKKTKVCGVFRNFKVQ